MTETAPPERDERSDMDRLSDLFPRFGGLPTGTRAALRRMDPEAPGRSAAALFAALETAKLSRQLGRMGAADAADTMRRWATIVQVAALLSGTGGARAHRPGRELGRAVAAAGYSEARMMRLLAARGPALRGAVVRLARFLASRGAQPVDLRPLAALVLHEGRNEERAEAARLRIARGFFSSGATSGGNDDTNENRNTA